MAQKKGTGGSKPSTKTKVRNLPQGGTSLGMTPVGGESSFPALMAGTLLASDGSDVSRQMDEIAPTFGNVLNSIGVGVATSQEALDMGMVEIARSLSDTEINLVTQIIQELDDDGLPIEEVGETHLRRQAVSLINFINPQAHEWSHVALSMDMTVASMDVETGMTYNVQQSSSSTSVAGLWAFAGWFGYSDSSQELSGNSATDLEAAWATGQVRMDAMLEPRRTGKFPIPSKVSIGPQITIGLGVTAEVDNSGVITRSQDITITVRKADGSVNVTVPLTVESNTFTVELLDNGTATASSTNADGIVMVRVSRRIPNVIFGRVSRGTVTVTLGLITKDIEISL